MRGVVSDKGDILIYCRGLRSGTVPHTLVVGLGSACEIAMNDMEV